MATYDEVMEALRAADAAGNVEDAARLASIAEGLKNKPQESVAVSEPDIPAKIAGHPATRFAIGTAKFPLAMLQHGANTYDFMIPGEAGQYMNNLMTDLGQITERGRKARGSEGADWYDIAGQAFNPAMLKLGGLLSGTTGYLGKVGAGGLLGGMYGLGTPQEGGYSTENTLGNVGTGAAVGAAVPAVLEPIKGAAHITKDLWDIVRGNVGKLHTKYMRNILGEENVPQIANALKNADEIIPGGMPTSAEAVSGMPSGSPLIAHQKVTARHPGGLSGDFGERLRQQTIALKNYYNEIDKVTAPMREDALNNAKNIRVDGIVSKIDEIISKNETTDLARKTLNAVKRQIMSRADDGVIDARALYNIRKEGLGETISRYSKALADPVGVKKFSTGIFKKANDIIDDAIEGAGGKGWRDYLKKYSLMQADATDFVLRNKNMYKPVQPTSLQGGINVLNASTQSSSPRLLWRPIVFGNWLTQKLAERLEPAFDREAATRLLNPSMLGDLLEKSTPSELQKLLDEYLKLYGRSATIGLPTEAMLNSSGVVSNGLLQ